ncbi:hypothetical protein D9M70_443150 [compost metagenome]
MRATRPRLVISRLGLVAQAARSTSSMMMLFVVLPDIGVDVLVRGSGCASHQNIRAVPGSSLLCRRNMLLSLRDTTADGLPDDLNTLKAIVLSREAENARGESRAFLQRVSTTATILEVFTLGAHQAKAASATHQCRCRLYICTRLPKCRKSRQQGEALRALGDEVVLELEISEAGCRELFRLLLEGNQSGSPVHLVVSSSIPF